MNTSPFRYAEGTWSLQKTRGHDRTEHEMRWVLLTSFPHWEHNADKSMLLA